MSAMCRRLTERSAIRQPRSALVLLALLVLPTSFPTDAAPKVDTDLARRVAAVSDAYLGTSYAPDPLGEGTGPDPDPLIDRTRVDCVTFLEQVLAEALAPAPDAVPSLLARIRYRGGRIDLVHRNHYFVADWIPNNRWFVSDITTRVGGGAVRSMTKQIDRGRLLRGRGCPPEQCRVPIQRLTTPYVPRAAVDAVVLERIPAVAIAVFVQDRPGIEAAHTGLLLKRAGEVYLRHASQRRRQVVEERLRDYLKWAPARIVGLKVCAVHSPRRGSSVSDRRGAGDRSLLSFTSAWATAFNVLASNE